MNHDTHTTFLFGNGLSRGVNDELFELGALTRAVREVVETLELAPLAAFDSLAAISHADTAAPNGHDVEYNFEALAGPLHRMVQMNRQLAGTLDSEGDSEGARCARATADVLEDRYVQLVGAVLQQVLRAYNDLTPWDVDSTDAAPLMAFMDALWQYQFAGPDAREASGKPKTGIFTLNYDALMHTGLVKAKEIGGRRGGQGFFDGFRDGEWDRLLDWGGKTALYHLHGAMNWYAQPDGAIRKESPTSSVNPQLWMGGHKGRRPVVVLADLKTAAVQDEPFKTMYGELDRLLRQSELLVVGGYGFGDVPLNRAIRRFLAHSPDKQLRIWSPSSATAHSQAVEALTTKFGPPDGDQIAVDNYALPDVEAVLKLWPRSAREAERDRLRDLYPAAFR